MQPGWIVKRKGGGMKKCLTGGAGGLRTRDDDPAQGRSVIGRFVCGTHDMEEHGVRTYETGKPVPYANEAATRP